MRLVRFGEKGQEKPGILDSFGIRRDCSALVEDWAGSTLETGQPQALVDVDPESLPRVAVGARWAAPVARPWKLIGIGLNYRDHAAESGMAIPEEPIVFFKASNTVVGPFDDVRIPWGSEKTDWEAELAVVIGRTARRLESPDQADECIAGYCLSNDVSERAFQLEHGGQWCKGKSCDTFNPLGPWLATSDEITDPQNLRITLDVNGQRRQTGNTRTMIFPVHRIIEYLSQFFTLEPGDVITTGTPPGVGLGMQPPTYLKPGDVMELAIEHLGRQKQTCLASS
jgi:2-keto-4-pentenoate hydratase/2-oxohepta-3-ene-1,7-dioic acid hydratase in catechol pathway